MCTVMFYPETLPAEKRSRENSQKAVDRLMAYDRQLSEPFTRDELREIFSGERWRFGELREVHALLTENEKRIVAELDLTPPEPPVEPAGEKSIFAEFIRDSELPVDPPSVEAQRRNLKAELIPPPLFEDHPFGAGSRPLWGGFDIYVWLDNCRFGNSRKNGFYYVRYQLSMLAWGSTAYAHPVLIVQKNKLRPDQVEYLERKCRETLAAAERLRRARQKN